MIIYSVNKLSGTLFDKALTNVSIIIYSLNSIIIMKRIFISLSIIFCAFSVFAQTQKDVKSTVKEVTIFTNGAQVTRSANINLQAGTSELVFSGISAYINVSSIQASGKGSFIILDTKYNVKYPEPSSEKETVVPASLLRKIELVQDSLADINYDLEAIKDNKDLFTKQKDMLINNPLMNGKGKSDSLPILKNAMDFLDTKLSSINAELQRIKKEENKVTAKRNKLTTRLSELNDYKYKLENEDKIANAPINQIVVTVSAKDAVVGKLLITYMVSSAGWTPSYDIRVNDTDGPVSLTLKANVYQSSGEEWNDVKLKLSTNNPYKSNIKPELATWYLTYYMPMTSYTSNFIGGVNAPAAQKAGEYGLNDVVISESANKKYKKDKDESKSISNYIVQTQNITNFEYEVNLPYTIPSDNKYHLVYVKDNDNIPARYNHFIVPKLDKDAFLVAKLTGWEDMNLIAAKANIYFEGTYIGETIIDPSIIADTLELSLGRDKGIAVTRKKLKDKESEQIMGSNRSKTITIELTVRNNKNANVELSLEDQIPVSNDKDIKVSFKDDEFTGNYNETTGLLKWKLQLKPKENKVLRFTYTIKYDKDRSLINVNNL